MDRRAFLTLAASTVALPQNVIAQSNTRIIKIGWLTAQQEASLTPYLVAMRQGFSELGYVEGQNLVIDYRFANDQLEQVSELAAALVKSGVELMVVQGAAVSEVAKQSLPIPIVYVFSGDPTAAGSPIAFPVRAAT
jgi:putative ABC transport system substrate-binding protein